MTLLPPPCDLGLPERFTSWYPYQDKAVSWIMDHIESDVRFLALAAPTGCGKSLIAALASVLSGRRTLILTATKALQSQYKDQVGELGMADLRGGNAYRCTLDAELNADEGPCRVGVSCGLSCPHRSAVALASSPKTGIVITNYSCWMFNSDRIQGIDKDNIFRAPIQLLVLDEAHRASNQLSEYCSISFRPEDGLLMGVDLPDKDCGVDYWVAWASHNMPDLAKQLKLLGDEVKSYTESDAIPPRPLMRQLRKIDNLYTRLIKTNSINGKWVVGNWGEESKLTPVWPAEYAERDLFCGVEKVLLMSATLTPKTLDLLGVKDYLFHELPSSFPVSHRPVVHVPSVRMNHRVTMDELKWWVARIDQIIDRRQDRKGLIHTTSYTRRNLVMRESRFREIMCTHEGGNLRSVVMRFKQSAPPAVIVSPSLTEGYDFPDDLCSYVIIGKVAYPDTRDPVAKARSEMDRDWAAYEAMQTLIQSAGRAVRTPEDKCEIIILDDDFKWFWKRYQHFAPQWFRDAVRFSNMIPQPFF